MNQRRMISLRPNYGANGPPRPQARKPLSLYTEFRFEVCEPEGVVGGVGGDVEAAEPEVLTDEDDIASSWHFRAMLYKTREPYRDGEEVPSSVPPSDVEEDDGSDSEHVVFYA